MMHIKTMLVALVVICFLMFAILTVSTIATRGCVWQNAVWETSHDVVHAIARITP